MKRAMILSTLFAVLLAGPAACAAKPPSSTAWLDRLVAEFDEAPVANPPHRILRYRYREQTVYYVPPSCCDQPSALYNDAGTLLCEPDGGITGRGDGRCADFHERRSEESVFWSDPRSR